MKKAYRKLTNKMRTIIIYIYTLKVGLGEWYAILKKRKLYRDIKLNEKQQEKIDALWLEHYDKKVSKRWHKLYMSINNKFRFDYFPDYIFSTKLEPKLNPIEIAKFYSDKGLTELLYNNVKEIVFPKTIIINCSGNYHDSSRAIISKYDAIEQILKLQEFIIKPTIGGSSGKGVQLISLIGLDRDSKIDFIKRLLSQYGENYIVQLRLEQHHLLKTLYQHSINTIRLITYTVENKVYHGPLALRIGVKGNIVDNIHSGGIVVGLSDDGYLKKFGYQLGYCDSKTKFQKHPDSGVLFEDYYIPKISKTIEIAKKLHVNTPHLCIISWDFMINEFGETVLVEGNYFGQSIWFPQVVNEKSFFGSHTKYFINLCSKK